MGILVSSFQHNGWLTNSYCIKSSDTRSVLIVDAGATPGVFHLDSRGIEAVLLTHDHVDHIDKLHTWPDSLVVAHSRAFLSGPAPANILRIDSIQELNFGTFEVLTIPTPGHSADHLSFAVRENGTENYTLFTGDLLFKGSLGGTRGGSFTELKNSIELLLNRFGEDTEIRPGHGASSTLGYEIETNPFIRGWRYNEVVSKQIEFQGSVATLLVQATDYDGDDKLWLRLHDGTEIIVAG